MPRANTEVNQNFTATGQSATYKYRKQKDIDSLIVSVNGASGGAFVGTVALETSIPDAAAWVTVPDGTFTAEMSSPFYPGGDVDIRWNCTAYTSGTITVRIA